MHLFKGVSATVIHLNAVTRFLAQSKSNEKQHYATSNKIAGTYNKNLKSIFTQQFLLQVVQ